MEPYRAWGISCENAMHSSPSFPSSFTAINAPTSAQVPTPEPSASVGELPEPVLTPRRNPTVAEYLGRDSETEISKFQRSSSPPPVPPPKRRRKAREGQSARTKVPQSILQQPEEGTAIASKAPGVSFETKQAQLRTFEETHRPSNDRTETDSVQFSTISQPNDTENVMAHHEQAYMPPYPDYQLDSRPKDPDATEDQFWYGEDTMLDSDIADEDLLLLMSDIDNATDELGDCRPADGRLPTLTSNSEIVDVPSSPIGAVPDVLISGQLSTQPLDIKPIVRQPFPNQVRDRSPVIGLTPNCLLRTCFRVGEAINVGRNAVKSRKNVLIELYARVLKSERSETKQHFVLGDLFHSKKPYLEADYDAAIWSSTDLHEFDSRVFLSNANRMCRCILSTNTNTTSNGRERTPKILNIWAAKKDDIVWVEGIVNS